jgi:hypothetical protein
MPTDALATVVFPETAEAFTPPPVDWVVSALAFAVKLFSMVS